MTASQSYGQAKSFGYLGQEQIGFSDRLYFQFGARVDRNSAFGTSLFLATVRKVGAARTSMAFSLVPAVSAVLSWLILGQLPTVGVVIGLVLGAAACVIGSRGAPVQAKVTTIRTAVEEQLSGR